VACQRHDGPLENWHNRQQSAVWHSIGVGFGKNLNHMTGRGLRSLKGGLQPTNG